jgi:16S rRNA (cytosine967-C5)-methyltransferase
MTPAARIAAAIEILTELDARPRPAADVLKDWGRAHRFAGSGDRAAIGSLVYDALRRKASGAFVMGADTPRAVMLGMLALTRELELAAIEKLFDGARFAPDALADDERERLAKPSLRNAPPHVKGDYPEWLDAAFEEIFGAERAEEGAALAARAPLDLRANALLATREKLLTELSHLQAAETGWSSFGIRIPLDEHGRNPPVTAEPSFQKGWFEVQDEGSQLAAILTGAKAGEQVLDLCAGAGGKTLALAALMENRGQIFAHDGDLRRLAPIHDRIKRAQARNIQVRAPKGKQDVLSDLEARMDLVLVDAPCTGTGVWRRHPDAKWRMRPGALDIRVKEQRALLDRAAAFAKPGGRIAYVTCSLLPAENGAQVRDFVARHEGWSALSVAEICAPLGARGTILRKAAKAVKEGLLLTPRRTETDGFFISVLQRKRQG